MGPYLDLFLGISFLVVRRGVCIVACAVLALSAILFQPAFGHMFPSNSLPLQSGLNEMTEEEEEEEEEVVEHPGT